MVDWLELWRQKMDLTNFILAGHSYGGYVCGLYACRYEVHVKKLLMLSAIGLNSRPHGYDTKRFFKEFKHQRESTKCVHLGECMWSRHCTPFGFFRNCCFCVSDMFMKNFINRRFNKLSEQEKKDIKIYLQQTLLRKGSTEYGIFHCFDFLMFPKHGLHHEDRLGGLSIPISFFYGDNDWVNPDGGEYLVSKSKFKDSHSHIYYIKNSDHHLYFDNP